MKPAHHGFNITNYENEQLWEHPYQKHLLLTLYKQELSVAQLTQVIQQRAQMEFQQRAKQTKRELHEIVTEQAFETFDLYNPESDMLLLLNELIVKHFVKKLNIYTDSPIYTLTTIGKTYVRTHLEEEFKNVFWVFKFIEGKKQRTEHFQIKWHKYMEAMQEMIFPIDMFSIFFFEGAPIRQLLQQVAQYYMVAENETNIVQKELFDELQQRIQRMGTAQMVTQQVHEGETFYILTSRGQQYFQKLMSEYKHFLKVLTEHQLIMMHENNTVSLTELGDDVYQELKIHFRRHPDELLNIPLCNLDQLHNDQIAPPIEPILEHKKKESEKRKRFELFIQVTPSLPPLRRAYLTFLTNGYHIVFFLIGILLIFGSLFALLGGEIRAVIYLFIGFFNLWVFSYFSTKQATVFEQSVHDRAQNTRWSQLFSSTNTSTQRRKRRRR